jgi:hypothetical protein
MVQTVDPKSKPILRLPRPNELVTCTTATDKFIVETNERVAANEYILANARSRSTYREIGEKNE